MAEKAAPGSSSVKDTLNKISRKCLREFFLSLQDCEKLTPTKQTLTPGNSNPWRPRALLQHRENQKHSQHFYFPAPALPLMWPCQLWSLDLETRAESSLTKCSTSLFYVSRDYLNVGCKSLVSFV